MTDNPLEFDPQLATDATGMTINNFHRASKSDPPSLILRPAFQRNLVWNKKQQSFLIDSILRGLPVPELYVQISTSADGHERLTVVDGQQRISACIAFIDGDLRLDDSDDLDSRWRQKSFDELDESLRARFRGFKFVVRDLPTSADDKVLREIFRRLNRTVEALEPQELRHAAYTGRFIHLVERAGSAAALAGLGVFTPKDYLRRRNDEFAAEVLLAVDAGAFPNKKEGLEQLFLTYERRGLPEERHDAMARRFGRAVAFIEATDGALRRTRFRNKSDCYSLLVFLARHAESLGDIGAVVKALMPTLVDFSDRVNSIKRQEAPGNSVATLVSGPLGSAARTYLRAVERAASDRLNRVRRNEALESVLGSVLEQQAASALSGNDQTWRLAGEDLEEVTTDDGGEVGGLTVQEALLSEDEVGSD